jgi:hypothetical protein
MIIYFAAMTVIELVDVVDASTNKSFGGTWQCRQSLTTGHAAIMDANEGARVGRKRRSPPI